MRNALFVAALALSAVAFADTVPPTHSPAPAIAPLQAATPMTWKQLAALPAPAAGIKLSYGTAPQQFGELRIPLGGGKFPVAVLVHGGCWQAEYDYAYFNHLAAALTAQGVATWTIEYRRLGDEGGGWPNTLIDVARATDHLRVLARTHAIDATRVVSVGHSAGGQLALWLAARHKLPKASDLYLPKPLQLQGVVGLAAITDLAWYRVGKLESCNASVDQLMGGAPEQQRRRYAQASPRALLPLGVPQWLVQGGKDPIVPLDSVADYVQAVSLTSDTVSMSDAADLGHFDVVAPETSLGKAAISAVRSLLGMAAGSPVLR